MSTEWVSYALEIVILLFIVAYLLHRYISLKIVPLYAYVVVFFGYFLSISILFLMPVDVAMAQYGQCVEQTNNPSACEKPFNYFDPTVMTGLWNAIYWTTWILTWALYPLLQSYVCSGQFTVWDRIKAAVRENLIYYAVYFGIGLIFFVWLFFAQPPVDAEGHPQSRLTNTFRIAMTLANVYGLFLVICFMGYGIVAIPRALWRNANLVVQLNYHKWMLVTLNQNMRNAHKELIKTLKLIKKTSDKVHQNDIYRVYVDKIIEQCPPEYSELTIGEGTVKTNYSDLVALNERLKNAIHNYNTAKCLYEERLKKAFELDDIIKTKEREQRGRISWTFKSPRVGRLAALVDYLEWIWWIYIAKWFFITLSICCAVVSIALVWSEVVFFVPPNLSLFALIVHAPGVDPFLLQVLVFVPLCYMLICTYSSLFKLRLFNYYKLLPHQQTDANSILFSAAYLCRLVAPLALNLLYVLNFAIKQSPFISVMGTMEVVPFFGKQFNIYFPMFVLFFVFATLFNLWSKIFCCCNVRRFQFDEDWNDAQLENGNQLLIQEREERLKGTTVFDSELKRAQNEDIEARELFNDEIVEEKNERESNHSSGFGSRLFRFFSWRSSKDSSLSISDNVKGSEHNRNKEKKFKSKIPKIQNEPSSELLPSSKSTRNKFAWEEITDSEEDEPKEYGSV